MSEQKQEKNILEVLLILMKSIRAIIYQVFGMCQEQYT